MVLGPPPRSPAALVGKAGPRPAAAGAQELVAAKLPRLHRRLAELGCDMTILATDWFLCLYATSLPCEVRPRAARNRALVEPPA